jgi:two-component system sporulation sensor kinase A
MLLKLVALPMFSFNIMSSSAGCKTEYNHSQFISRLDEGFELLELVEGKKDTFDFVFLEVNPAYEHLTGLKANMVIGKRKKEVATFAEQRWYDYAIQALKTGKTLQYEYYNSLVKRYLATQFIPVSDKRIAVLFKDVTERKNSEIAVIESEERLKIYLESTPVAVFVANPEGKYLFVNEGASRLLQYSKEELLSMSIPQVLYEDYLSLGLLEFSLVKQTGKSRSELCLKRKDGSPVYVILTATKMPDGNFIANCEDITERKELEKQLQANERLAAIGSTAGMVGHDIRNPLQAIIGDAFLLKDYLTISRETATQEDILESLNGIEKNVGYINKIVADLQDYARPLNPEYSVVPLFDIISSAFKTIDLPDNIKLVVDIKNNPLLRTDPTFIQRALTNLVNNAIQAMDNGGTLTVRSAVSDANILVSVEDTGVGIAEEIRARLFSPMTTTKAKGQGLGLAVVKRLVEALNGTVDFESEVGKGTRFTVRLPKPNV